jgi:hypothetical protein
VQARHRPQSSRTTASKRVAVLVDADPAVEKWLKPGRAQFQIEYRSGDNYEPDFVVETDDRMLIAEVKASNELTDIVVQAKARAATKWCKAAAQHAAETGGKPWYYALIGGQPDNWQRHVDGIDGSFTRLRNTSVQGSYRYIRVARSG